MINRDSWIETYLCCLTLTVPMLIILLLICPQVYATTNLQPVPTPVKSKLPTKETTKINQVTSNTIAAAIRVIKPVIPVNMVKTNNFQSVINIGNLQTASNAVKAQSMGGTSVIHLGPANNNNPHSGSNNTQSASNQSAVDQSASNTTSPVDGTYAASTQSGALDTSKVGDDSVNPETADSALSQH